MKEVVALDIAIKNVKYGEAEPAFLKLVSHVVTNHKSMHFAGSSQDYYNIRLLY